MSNGYFNELLNAIVTKIKQEIPEFKDVAIFGGGFNGLSDVQNFTAKAPALRIGLGAINPTLNINTSQLEASLDLSLIFVTKDVNLPNSRHGIALELLEKVLLLVKEGNWGIENTYKTERTSVNAQNYYSSELLKTGIALWGVTWQQKCLLGLDRFAEEGEFPNSYKANMDIDGDGNIDETVQKEL